MRKIRLTCKNWDTWSKTQGFLKMLTNKEEEKTREGMSCMIMLMNYTLYPTSVDVNDGASVELKGKLSCFNEQVKISEVFYCKGLLLCILKNEEFSLVVWNPYLGQSKRIEPKSFHGYPYHRYKYALGYKNKKTKSCSCHKILRFANLRMNNLSVRKDIWYEIYDLNSGSWTTLDVPHQHWCIPCTTLGISLNGNTYWPVTLQNSEGTFNEYGIINHMICFDFTKETFGPLLPLPFSNIFSQLVSLSCVKEEKLAAYCHEVSPNLKIEIWITTKIEAEMVLWNKFLTVDTGPVCDDPFSYASFFIHEEKKAVVVIDRDCNHYTANIIGEDGYFQKLDLQKYTEGMSWPACWPSVCSYVPSLEPIKQ